LGKTCDAACEEEIRLERLYLKARERRCRIGKDFADGVMAASTKLLHVAIDITELRDAIFAHLLPGEIAAFYTGCGLRTGREAIAAALSPLRIILSGDRLLEAMLRDGYNLTLICGTKHELLYGLSSLPSYNPDTRRSLRRYWSAVLVATKEESYVPCSAAFLPLTVFGCPGIEADAAEDAIDESGTLRTVTLRYGPDMMSIWMPLSEQSTTFPISIPQAIFHSFVDGPFPANWRFQPKMFFSVCG